MVPLAVHWYGTNGAAAAAAARDADPSSQFAPVGWLRGQTTVPDTAITEIEGKPTVFVMERDLHLLVATPVVLGRHAGAEREVLSGVSRGQFVVADALSTQRALASR
ncbi:MAG TPA: hypothetical protein VHE30_09690 [Polyangiaceae bacterium]|nr:hypothetical protein [Polyangiaceae bacterium]